MAQATAMSMAMEETDPSYSIPRFWVVLLPIPTHRNCCYRERHSLTSRRVRSQALSSAAIWAETSFVKGRFITSTHRSHESGDSKEICASHFALNLSTFSIHRNSPS